MFVLRLLQPPKLEQRPRMNKSQHSEQYQRLLAELRRARKDAELTQVEAGRQFGAHASFVSKFESGARRNDVVELAEFCQLYGIRLSTFLRRVGLK